MTKMRAVDAAVLILEKEGATQAFGLPGRKIFKAGRDRPCAHGGTGQRQRQRDRKAGMRE